MSDELEIYELKISNEDESNFEVDFIALVDRPAIQRNFQAFADEFVEPGASETESEFIGRCMSVLVGDEGYEQDQAAAICYSKWADRSKMSEGVQLSIQDPEQRIVSGALMIPDKLILRRDQRGEYFIKFTAETIKQIAVKYAKKGYQRNVNLQHDKDQKIEAVLFESWVKDSERGIGGMKGYEDLPDGTWFGSMHISDDAGWERVKNGDVKGFSVEGIFQYERAEPSPEDQMMSRIVDILQSVR